MRAKLISKPIGRGLEWSLSLAAALILSACSNLPQEVLNQTSLDSQHAIVVIGVSQKDLPPRGRLAIVLDRYSVTEQKETFTPFYYEGTNGPPQSAIAKYYVYRVPAGSYKIFMDARPLPVVASFAAPAGQAVYLGDFVVADNPAGFELRYNMPIAQSAVATLLPVGLPLVKAY